MLERVAYIYTSKYYQYNICMLLRTCKSYNSTIKSILEEGITIYVPLIVGIYLGQTT